MKNLILLLFSYSLFAQPAVNYGVSIENPFGKLNPEAPSQLGDFEPMIGVCDCTSTTRNGDQSWTEPQKMTWTFKYIMNGTAVQDESIKEDGSHSGSIRQFIADSSKWYVHWYSNNSPSTALPVWEGTKKGEDIVLYNEQKAPNGMDGYFRLTFSDIDTDGFKWAGEWVDTTEAIVFPTWKIDCKKRKEDLDRAIIEKNIRAFSRAYMNQDANAIANFYTQDAKIFPNNLTIISNREAIFKYWEFSEGLSNMYHKVTPSEIKIVGDYAYDYGHYEGSLRNQKDEFRSFKGKYVIIWQKIDGDWKIYLDIWNAIK